MMGISYGGISQLFVAATRPPSLAAITPLSVIDNTATTLYPGGILNTGFALSWAKDRVARRPAGVGDRRPGVGARPASSSGDATCKANQVLHHAGRRPDRQDPRQPLLRPEGRRPAGARHLRPQDRARRSSWPASGPTSRPAGTAPTLRRRTSPARGTSGSRSPTARTSTRWTPRRSTAGSTSSSSTSRAARPSSRPRPSALAPVGLQHGDGRPGRDAARRPDPGAARATRRRSAPSRRCPPVRILFDNGAGGRRPAPPVPGFEHSFSRFPPPGTSARSWYLGADGALTDAKPAAAGGGRLHLEPAARARRPTSPATPGSGRTACGPPRRPTTGRRARRGARCPT